MPAETLAAPATVALLARYRVDPILAVWPSTLADAARVAPCFTAAGLRPALWPMLADADGRWIGAANAPRFCAFAERLARELGAGEVVLDLEPPIESLRDTLASRAVTAHLLPVTLDGAAFRAAHAHVTGLAARLHDGGALVSAAVALPVLLDRPAGEGGSRRGGLAWQEALGTPVDGIPWDHVSPMLYTSIVEGWSRGLLARRDARAILAWACRASAARFGPRAGASLGAVGTGAFGDEPVYRTPAELADDVAIARAASVDDLALFELGGLLRRPPAEAWLEAFTETAPLRTTCPESLSSGGHGARWQRFRATGAGLGVLSRHFLQPVTERHDPVRWAWPPVSPTSRRRRLKRDI